MRAAAAYVLLLAHLIQVNFHIPPSTKNLREFLFYLSPMLSVRGGIAASPRLSCTFAASAAAECIAAAAEVVNRKCNADAAGS